MKVITKRRFADIENHGTVRELEEVFTVGKKRGKYLVDLDLVEEVADTAEETTVDLETTAEETVKKPKKVKKTTKKSRK